MDFKALWRRIKKLNFYSKFGLFGMLFTFLLLLLGSFLGFDLSFFFPQWYLNILPIPFIMARFVASASYIGAEVDLFKKNSANSRYEKWGTGLGILFGLALGVSLDIVNPTGINFINLIKAGLVVVSCVNTCGSLSSRLSTCKDPERRLKHEKYAIGIFTFIGLALSIVLVFTAAATAVSIVGVTSFFMGGAPILLASIFFIANVTSQMASTGDYLSKMYSFLYSPYTQDKKTKERVKERFNEYRGAAVGVSAGVVIAAVIIIAIAISQPHVLTGLIGFIAAILIITTCISVVTGITSRFGKMHDNLKKVEAEEASSTVPSPTPSLSPSTAVLSRRFRLAPHRSASCPSLLSFDKKPLALKKPRAFCTAPVSQYSFLKRQRVFSEPPSLSQKKPTKLIVHAS